MNTRTFLALSLTAIAPSASAMMLSPRGEGQVLVFPYYTVNGGNSTLITLVNTTADGKALKLRFHEGYDGRNVLDLNVYLGPFDAWSAQVADLGGVDSDGATLFSSDASCTVPTLDPVPTLPGVRAMNFSDASYAGENTPTGPTGNADGGPVTIDRTREGHMDVFEMGVLTNAKHNSLLAASNKNASGCAQLQNAWNQDGYWQQDATTDLAPPSGGLYGTEGIIDVAQGLFYSVNAEPIDGFSTAIQHTGPDADAPDLDTPSPSGNGLTAAFVPIDGKIVELDYARPVDAVSALFMTDVLTNDFDTAADIGATSDWVVTSPTKRFYVDSRFIGNAALASPPFDYTFTSNYASVTVGSQQVASGYPYSCVFNTPTVYSRDGQSYLVNHSDADGLFTSRSLNPCLETSVLTFKTTLDDSFPLPYSALCSHLTNATDPSGVFSVVFGDVDSIPFSQGFLSLDLSHDGDQYYSSVPPVTEQQYLTPAANGNILYGLPVVGFLAVNYVNANVAPGVLANYSGAYPFHGSVRCTNSSKAGNSCN